MSKPEGFWWAKVKIQRIWQIPQIPQIPQMLQIVQIVQALGRLQQIKYTWSRHQTSGHWQT